MSQYTAKDKQKCHLCGAEFPHNKNGFFTTHLKTEHGLELNAYLALYLYNKDDLQCQTCGEMVEMRRGQPNKYCDQCFRKARLKQGEKACVICGNRFSYENSIQSKNSTCSKECRHALVGKKIKKFQANLSKQEKQDINAKMQKTKVKLGTDNKGNVAWNKGKTNIYSMETIEKMRQATIWQMKNQKVHKTLCEKRMESMLQDMGLRYKYSFVIQDKQYDFCLLDYNVLIECDGDYWHGNLSTGKYKQLNEIQTQNLKNDMYKTILAQANGYYLIRFWEYEIMNHIDIVREKLAVMTDLLKDNQQPSLEGNL